MAVGCPCETIIGGAILLGVHDNLCDDIHGGEKSNDEHGDGVDIDGEGVGFAVTDDQSGNVDPDTPHREHYYAVAFVEVGEEQS